MLNIQTNRLYKARLSSSKLCVSDIPSASEVSIGTGMGESILETIDATAVKKSTAVLKQH